MTKFENKYQEALNSVRKAYVESDHYDEEDINLLQELVDKETPVLVTDIHVDEFYCPKCHAEITHDISNYGARPKYCEECGQKLDWGCYDD